MQSPPGNRNCLRYTITALMALTAVIAVVSAVWGPHVRNYVFFQDCDSIVSSVSSYATVRVEPTIAGPYRVRSMLCGEIGLGIAYRDPQTGRTFNLPPTASCSYAVIYVANRSGQESLIVLEWSGEGIRSP
jgi:hypothetical protein